MTTASAAPADAITTAATTTIDTTTPAAAPAIAVIVAIAAVATTTASTAATLARQPSSTIFFPRWQLTLLALIAFAVSSHTPLKLGKDAQSYIPHP